MDETNTPTCTVCQDLEPCHLTILVPSLLEGIAAGCASCTLLKDVVSPFGPISAFQVIRTRVDCTLYVSGVFEGAEEHSVSIEVYADPDKAPRWKCIGPARPVPVMASSTTSIGLIKQWLDECQATHTSCAGLQTALLPTRVINVGESSENVSLHVSNAGEHANYTALSHCWGGQTPLSTTKATLEQHQQSICFDAKSRTFAEAADVSRALGFRYLWIDSLCIIQDDPDDWATEAAKMSQVYSNAALTLSADGANDTSKGLFGNTLARVWAHNTHTIVTAGLDDKPVPIYARLRTKCPSDPGTAPHSSLATKPSKLSTRAWVLQERILSPRMVHFHNEELVWSCVGQSRCECRLAAGTSSFGTFRRLLTSSSSDPAAARELLLIEWTKLVEEFTTKGLTYAKDRLPALSGLAALTHQNLNPAALSSSSSLSPARYLAGLWSTDMEYSLLWLSDHEAAAESKTRITRMPTTPPYAPSWSWASVVGPVGYINRHLDQLTHRRSGKDEISPVFEVLRASAEPVTANPYGPVKAGRITVRGQVLPVVFDLSRGTWRPTPRLGGGGSEENSSSRVKPIIVPDVMDEDPRWDRAAGIKTLTGEFVMLRVAVYIWEGLISSERTEVVAMLLERVPLDRSDTVAAGEKVYMRKGMVLHAFHSKVVWEAVPVETITIF